MSGPFQGSAVLRAKIDMGHPNVIMPGGSELLWMVAKSTSHHFETIGSLCWLAFTGESGFQRFSGGAGFCL